MTNFATSAVNAFQNMPQATLGGFSAASASADGYGFDRHLSDSLASDQSARDVTNKAAVLRPSYTAAPASAKSDANNPSSTSKTDNAASDEPIVLNEGKTPESPGLEAVKTDNSSASDTRTKDKPVLAASTENAAGAAGQNEPVAVDVAAKTIVLGQNLLRALATDDSGKAETPDDEDVSAKDGETDISVIDPSAALALPVSPAVVASQTPAEMVANDDAVISSFVPGTGATPEQMKALRAKLEESGSADTSATGSSGDVEGSGADISDIDSQRFSQLLGDGKKVTPKTSPLIEASAAGMKPLDDVAASLPTPAEALKSNPHSDLSGKEAVAPSGTAQVNNAAQGAAVGSGQTAQGPNTAAADQVAASTSSNNTDAGALPAGVVAGEAAQDISASNPLPFATLGIGGSTSGHMAAGMHGVDRGPLSSPQPYVAAQVSMQISKTVSEGGDHFSIRLDPAELGRVEVKLHFLSDGKVTAAVSADNQQTLDLLQRDSRALDRALQDAGLRTDSGSLSFSLRQQGQQGQQQQPSFSSGNAGRGGGPENIDDTMAAVNAAASRSYVSNRALDITV